MFKQLYCNPAVLLLLRYERRKVNTNKHVISFGNKMEQQIAGISKKLTKFKGNITIITKPI